ncbi:glycosyltransferase family 2 protein [Microbacterium aquimaris]|uniref:Glycosyltransferase family A protein n=1 Tax=Microbacterium aquimaris TaxID=459816 RepID=A0ABU5N680_9MICO|nr:glycosyltransferase family A protein [Microbacterium aquimaris]MDZ8161550.1 glycosyltransferase family A protein [Microbacterium aquimaris]
MSPRVSIITRTKDRPLLLARALSSICSQTFTDFEVIIVNDGGDPDVVSSCVQALAEPQRARIRRIDHERPHGRWPAANAGVHAARGEFLVLHDDDDSWDPRFLETCVQYLEENPERAGVVARTVIVREHLVNGEYEAFATEPFVPESVAPLLMDQMRFNHFVPIAFLYRSSLHDELGPYDERHPVVADWQFNTQVLLQGPLEYVSPRPLAFWHQRPSVAGVDGNSVIADGNSHALSDALLRDEAFRSTVTSDGTGLVLYMERRFTEFERSMVARMEARHLVYRAVKPLVLRIRRLRRRNR